MNEVVAVISPRYVAEAVHGKACLLTDTMIAQLLDVLKLADAISEIGQEAVNDLYAKLVALFSDADEAQRIKWNAKVEKAKADLEIALVNVAAREAAA